MALAVYAVSDAEGDVSFDVGVDTAADALSKTGVAGSD